MGSSKKAGHVTSNVGGSPVFKPAVNYVDRSVAQPSPDAKRVEPVEEEAKATAEEVEERRANAIAENTVEPEAGDVDTHVSKEAETKEATEEDADEQKELEGDEQEDE